MRKIITILLVMLSIVGLFSCLGGVEFELNFVVDGEIYDTVTTNGKEIVKIPNNPAKEGYTFDGWYWDKGEWNKPFTANSLLDAPLSSNMSVYAKWNCVHSASDWIIDSEATCKSEGSKHKECTECEAVLETGKIEKLTTHTPAEAVKENFVDSDCKNEGSYNSVVYCSVCEAKLSSEVKTVDKKEHTPSEWIEDTPATCKVAGSKHKECTECEEVLETGKIEKLTTHTPDKAVQENFVDSDCENEGSYDIVVYCKECNCELSRTKKVLLKSHNFVSDVCTKCGSVNSSTGLSFTLNSDGKGYTLTDIGSFNGANLLIGSYNGLPVTTIAEGTFSDSEGIRTLTIGKGVLNIGNSSFYNSKDLVSVTISDSVVSIGESAFRNCKNLVAISIPNGVTNIGEFAFCDCWAVESLVIGRSVVAVGDSAFYKCTNLKELKFNADSMSDLDSYNDVFRLAGVNTGIKVLFGANVTRIPSYLFGPCASYESPKITSIAFEKGSVCERIGSNAFDGCKSIKSVEIPASIKTIGKHAFDGCVAITSINFNATSMDDLTPNNYVFDDAGVKSSGITVTVGANVTKIPAFLFSSSNSPKISYVVFAKGSICETIGCMAFHDCSELVNINIPASVKTIEDKAFERCTNLTSVKFENPKGWSAAPHYGEPVIFLQSEISNTTIAATYLRVDYYSYTWTRE